MNTENAERQYEFGGFNSGKGGPKVASDSKPGIPQSTKRGGIKKKIILSDRDFEILEFVLEMKFVSLDEVCAKFFKGSSDGKEVAGFWYAKKRLAQLEGTGYLGSTRSFSESKRFYFSKLRSFMTLKNLFLEKNLPRPPERIDGRTVAHDYLALRLRLELEKRDMAHTWISDRSLKVQTGILGELTAGYSPDGVQTPAEGEPVAFELEIALKSKARYQDKVRRYVQWMREHRGDPSAFKKVHYVTTNTSVKKHLDNFTAMYRQLFKVEMVSEYITGEVGLK